MGKHILKSCILLAILISSLVGTTSAVIITSVDDLDVTGMVVGLQAQTNSYWYVQDNFENATVEVYDTYSLALEAFENGDVHVLLADTPLLNLYVADHSEYAVLATFADEFLGIGIRENDNDLEDALNMALEEIINDTGENGYDAIYAKWFDGPPEIYDDGNGSYAYPVYEELQAGSTLKQILDSGEIEYGMDPTYPPFETKLNNGSYVGFDIDLMYELTDRISSHYNIDLNATIIDSAWDPILVNLQNEQFDVLLSAVTKTEVRDAEIDFTRAYYVMTQGVLGPADGVIDLTTENTSTTSSITSSSEITNGDTDTGQVSITTITETVNQGTTTTETTQASGTTVTDIETGTTTQATASHPLVGVILSIMVLPTILRRIRK